jgi:hypothetical protein
LSSYAFATGKGSRTARQARRYYRNAGRVLSITDPGLARFVSHPDIERFAIVVAKGGYRKVEWAAPGFSQSVSGKLLYAALPEITVSAAEGEISIQAVEHVMQQEKATSSSCCS